MKTVYQSETIETKKHPRHWHVWLTSTQEATVNTKLLLTACNNYNSQINKQNVSATAVHRLRTTIHHHHRHFQRQQKSLTTYYYRHILSIMCLVLAITNAVAAPATKSSSLTQSSTATSSSSTTALKALKNASITARNSLLHQTLLHQSAASNSRLRKRHSKRHSIGYDRYDLNENSTILEWVNPCGGYYDPTAVTNQKPKRRNPKKIYNALKIAAGHEFKILNDSQQAIDINNFEMWSMHRRTYKFLPKLKKNSSIALKRWYRNMQTYVASFAYLRRIQIKWDQAKAQCESEVAEELSTLLVSSRNILCELETAVNKTHPYQIQKRQLPKVSRQQMNKRLKMHTRETAIRNPGIMQEANSIDLKFVKYYYYEFVENMWKVLRKFTKRKGQVAIVGERKQINGIENKSLSAQNRRRQNKIKHKNKQRKA